MKKISALIIAVIMTCCVTTACSDSDNSSSVAQTTSKASSEITTEIALESEGNDESVAPTVDNSDCLTSQLSEKLKAGEFELDMEIDTGLGMTAPVVYKQSGSNYYMSIDMSALGADAKLDIYSVDGVSYMLNDSAKTYYVLDEQSNTDTLSAMGVSDILPEGDSKLTDTQTKDGEICETFTIVNSASSSDISLSDSSESGVTDDALATTYNYYYNAETKELTKITTQTAGITSTVNITKISTDKQEIKLPDVSGYTKGEGSDIFSAFAGSALTDSNTDINMAN